MAGGASYRSRRVPESRFFGPVFTAGLRVRAVSLQAAESGGPPEKASDAGR
jgi:hypothetical protein